jgi:hypothetical protein
VVTSVVAPRTVPARVMLFAFYLVVITLGILSMGFQLLASRLLGPSFGSAIDVWAWLISTFLAAFSAGAMLGGWVSAIERPSRTRWQLALASLAVLSLWFTANFGKKVIGIFETNMEPGQAPLVLSCVVVFFFPVLALSSFTPQCVQYVATRGMAPGRASGLVYGVSTLGNILGVLLTAFVLIPRAPVSTLLTTWLVVALVSLASLLAIFHRQSRA